MITSELDGYPCAITEGIYIYVMWGTVMNDILGNMSGVFIFNSRCKSKVL